MPGVIKAAREVVARAVVDAEDLYDGSELSEEELSDEGSDYGSGVWGTRFHSSTSLYS